MPRVTLIGASGFIGTALCRELARTHQVTVLTRSPTRAATADPDTGIRWRLCDPFSLPDLCEALVDCEHAIYLMHSLRPSSRLTQARSRDLDLVLADNFAQAASRNGVRQIIYLSTLMPESYRMTSLLWGRREVELALASRGTPLIVLRAGLVVGPGGSSSRLLVELVRRLGVLYLPPSTRSLSCPISVRDLERAVLYCLGTWAPGPGTYDVGGPELISYEDMLRTTAGLLGLRRRFVRLPWLPDALVAWNVRWITGARAELVGQMLSTLARDTRLRDNPVQNHIIQGALGFRESMAMSIDTGRRRLLPNPRAPLQKAMQADLRRAGLVRSIQRIILPPGQDAHWVASNYFRWLGSRMAPLIQTRSDDAGCVSIWLRWPRLLLLNLCIDPEHSSPERQVYLIAGGRLAGQGPGRPRLEFQTVLDGRYTMAAIHDFAPALPWHGYLGTQAIAHWLVMRLYQRHLGRLAR